MNSNPATASVFVSLSKIFNLNCFVDHSVSGTCRMWGMLRQGGDTRILLTWWSVGHVSRQPNHRAINRMLLVWDWTKSRLFVCKGIRAYCFINIQNLESGSDLWDCHTGLHYSSVPVNWLFNTKNSFLQLPTIAKLLWNVKFYLNQNFHELLS